MGSYISVGFVFKNDKVSLKRSILKNIIDSLKLDVLSIIIYKACYDLDGENWIEKRIQYKNINDNDLSVITENHYGHVLTTCSFLGIKNQMVNVTLYNGNYFFGYLIDLYEDNFSKKISYEIIEDLLIDYVKNSHYILNYDYAFCENEGEIEYSPYEIYDSEIDYSILVINDKKEGLITRKGEYIIDGITKR